MKINLKFRTPLKILKAELYRLEKIREDLQTKELIEAISKSKRSYKDILAYINGAKTDD